LLRSQEEAQQEKLRVQEEDELKSSQHGHFRALKKKKNLLMNQENYGDF
jgi:hypothetical protein